MDEELLSCVDVARIAEAAGLEAPYCCSSCHDDEIEGYSDPSPVTLERGVIAEVCCAKSRWTRENWAELAPIWRSGDWRKVAELGEELSQE